MRFGKKLAEATQSGRANEPYISYKELKHILNKLSALIGDQAKGSPANQEEEDSSGDEGAGREAGASAAAAASGSGLVLSRMPGDVLTRLESHQREFYRRIDMDLAQAKIYVQGRVRDLEIAAGEWQASAVVAGIFFTPEQLEEVSAQLPFEVQSQGELVEWLQELQPISGEAAAARKGLAAKYAAIANGLNLLLKYVEVNLTAVRKAFKKFEKKVGHRLPPDLRTQKNRDYTAHHDLLDGNVLQLLVSALQMQRLLGSPTLGPSMGAQADTPTIALLGPDSIELISKTAGNLEGLEEVMGGGPPRKIDVYAKPSGEAGRAPAGGQPAAVGRKPSGPVATAAPAASAAVPGRLAKAAGAQVPAGSPRGHGLQLQREALELPQGPQVQAAQPGHSAGAAEGAEGEAGEQPRGPRKRGARSSRGSGRGKAAMQGPGAAGATEWQGGKPQQPRGAARVGPQQPGQCGDGGASPSPAQYGQAMVYGNHIFLGGSPPVGAPAAGQGGGLTCSGGKGGGKGMHNAAPSRPPGNHGGPDAVVIDPQQWMAMMMYQGGMMMVPAGPA